MTEQEVQFGTNGQLYGTLSYPRTSPIALPAILIIAGSGPLDRDGNGKKKGQTLHLYNQLADFFTEHGFVSFRYDKRGTGKSAGHFLETGYWDLVEDAKAALTSLKKQACVDPSKVFILGHSEGCMIAPELAKTDEVAGLLLVAGAAQTLAEAQEFQRSQITQSLEKTKGVKGKLVRLLNIKGKVNKQGQKFDQKMRASNKDVIRYQGIRINAKWFKEHYEHDLYSSLAEVQCPILAVTGSKDVQATPDNVFQVKNYVKAEVEPHIITGMNHMLRDQPEDATIMQIKKVYKNIGEKPLSSSFLDVLQNWLNRHV
ncbi:abhydrolase [Halalkalibacter wakoensis JCM 9140]|uniref:Abhydrolase n=1 Tax=Halalkalibacter wakoensis JCM 9140 TaxID=1236970 RepID=W4Q6D9_9BACI|nr:alpha/beta fold hydrolase [Halalkalibacter wakoensis]GAE27562.1 abhydrolase [Halalkalibacter wakoensis JCM 9140]